MYYPVSRKDLDWFFKPFEGSKVARYPLTNLGIEENGNLLIEIAIAGFNKENVNIELKGNQLHVVGSNEPKENETVSYIQKHISSTSFERIIVLHEKYVGGDISAKITDGILSIEVIPKEQLKRFIKIDY